MDKDVDIILIGNYKPDKQESMLRFANLLSAGFTEAGYRTEIWHPNVFLGSYFKTTVTGPGKWMGYIDKWIIYPFILGRKQKKATRKNPNIRYHVCDHSNSPYLQSLPPNQSGITCHDVLAIRGAMGHADAYVSATSFGKILQQYILRNLLKAKLIGCNSKETLDKLKELAKQKKAPEKNWQIVHLSYNNDYKPMSADESWSLLARAGIKENTPFILNVGNSLIRKNRIFLLDVIIAIGNQWTGYVCFAGSIDDPELIERANRLGVQERMILLSKPDNNTLRALYSTCAAFAYPSLSEGFPWPTLEAQACGAPVITSNIQPMPEISGEGALHVNPLNASEFAKALLILLNPEFRNKQIEKGYKNAAKYAPPKMINDYLALHNLVRIKPIV